MTENPRKISLWEKNPRTNTVPFNRHMYTRKHMIQYSRQPTLMFKVSFTKNLYKGMSIEAIWSVLEIHIQKNHFFQLLDFNITGIS